MAGRKKGTPKTGGRKPNSLNKTTKEYHELFISIMNGQMDSISAALDEIKQQDAGKYINALSKLFQYYMPRKTDITTEGEKMQIRLPDIKITVNES